MTYTAVVRNAASGSERAMGVGVERSVQDTRREVEVVMQTSMSSRLDLYVGPSPDSVHCLDPCQRAQQRTVSLQSHTDSREGTS